jgi:hypothetical protein
MFYVKKPVSVEAIQIPTSRPTAREYYEWSKTAPTWVHDHDIWMTEEGLVIPTLEGNMLCRWGNWLLKGVKGELYPCDNEIFQETYEPLVGGTA